MNELALGDRIVWLDWMKVWGYIVNHMGAFLFGRICLSVCF